MGVEVLRKDLCICKNKASLCKLLGQLFLRKMGAIEHPLRFFIHTFIFSQPQAKPFEIIVPGKF